MNPQQSLWNRSIRNRTLASGAVLLIALGLYLAGALPAVNATLALPLAVALAVAAVGTPILARGATLVAVTLGFVMATYRPDNFLCWRGRCTPQPIWPAEVYSALSRCILA